MEKTYVIDTNVILHDPTSIFKFKGNKVVVPLSVIGELDSKKGKQNMVGNNARYFSRAVDNIMEEGKLSNGIYLEKHDITLFVEETHTENKYFPDILDKDKVDNHILSVASYHHNNTDNKTILVTRDTNLRIIADSLNLNVENYLDDAVDFDELYRGYKIRHNITRDTIDKFYEKGKLKPSVIGETDIKPNQIFNLKSSSSNSASSAFGIYDKDQDIIRPINTSRYPWSLQGRNREQKFALELLLNDDINLVSLVGKAGTGKTLMSLAAGLEKVINQNRYDKLVVLRPIVPMGNDIGYLPGDEEAKLSVWMRPIKDNLEYLISKKGDNTKLEDLERFVSMEALTYIRGRSIPNQFIILDECQNLSSHELKTIITRIGEGSKIVLTGDPYQIDHPYLDANSNGLTYAIENMKDSKLSGSVLLEKGERSPLAEEATIKL